MSVSRNAAYNVAGAALPSLLTLVTVPLYLEIVGLERYGILTLCWVVLGYSGFLDVGLRLTVARNIAAAGASDSRAAQLFWTSIALTAVMGLTGAALVYLGAKLYFGRIAQVSESFQGEVLSAMPLLACLVPLGMLGSVLGGALQGRERFLAINVLGAFGASLGGLLPLLFGSIWGPRLSILLAGSLTAQIIVLPLTYWAFRRAIHFPLVAPQRRLISELVSFSGWISLTVLANGLISTIDRLAIGSRIGAAAVPPYAIPYGLVSRIILIPHSLSAALFPRFAFADQVEARRLASSSVLAVAVINTPLTIAIIAVSEPFFKIWIGPELAATASPIAYLLAVGFWTYCIGHMAYSMLQATGRPDVVSKLLLAELIPYCLALFFGLWAFGVIGAAGAYSLRAIVDCLIFLFLAAIPAPTLGRLVLPAGLTVGAASAAASLSGTPQYLVLAVLFTTSLAWSALNIPDVLRPYLQRLIPKW